MLKIHGTKLRKLLLLTLPLAVALLFAPGAHAQSTGTFTGVVSDATGAAIPDATITITNPQTGSTRSVTSNGSGNYDIPNVPIGSYALTVTKAGFQTQKRSATELLTGQTIGLDLVLTVGSNTETIEVSTDTQQIKTATSEISTTIDQTQVNDLPLNQRNPIQLTTLTPGVALTGTGTEGNQQDNSGISVNGLRPTENNFQLDGVLYENRFFDSVPIMPNPDALQEFTIQASNYSAAFAGAGALVQLSTRSGTNQLHGSAFEFFRNTILDARSYFVRAPAVNQPFKLNQFGGTVGGPIVIPHIYNGRDKTFFFFSAEDLQRRSAATSSTIFLPTAAELAGNFSAFLPVVTNGVTSCPAALNGLAASSCKQIYDPVTHNAYTGNILTQTVATPTPFNALSLAVANQYVVPYLATANPVSGAYVPVETNNIDSTQYTIKVDHSFGQKDHFDARYFYNEYNYQRPFAAPNGFYAGNFFRNQDLALTDTHEFSNTLTLTISASAGRYARTQVPEAPGLKTLQALGATGVPLGTNVPIFPGVRSNISGYVNIFSGGALTQDPTTYEYKAQAIKVLGHHTLSLGFTYENSQINATDYSYTPGDNTFNGSRTQSAASAGGHPVADFLFGYDSTFFQDNGRRFYLREKRPSAFVQDDWKVNRDLTINAGLRWDPWLPPVDNNSTLVGFIPGQQSTVAPNAPRGLVFLGDQGVTQSVFHDNYKDFAPRLGFAYNVAGRGDTVVRGAYGLFYGFPEGLLYQRTDATQPVDLYLNIPAPANTWNQIYAAPGYTGVDPFPRAHVAPSQFGTYSFITPVSGGVLNPNSHVAYTEDYNLSVSQRLPGNYALDIAYVGNHALHVMGSRQFNPAVCAAGAPCANLNNSTCTTCTTGNENARRLYPGLGAVELADSYEYAIFNSLQVSVTHRVSRGLTLLGNVVWSKTIDNNSSAAEGNNGPSNPFNLNGSRGPADFDQRIRGNVSINYRLKDYATRPISAFFGNGWQFNTIIQSQTGLPFTVTSGTDRSLSGTNNDFADAVPGISPRQLPGANFQKQYFNTAAFVPAALGTFGNVHRNNITGPGYEEVSSSLFKDFFPNSRVHGRFQAEAFNVLNHPNFGNPASATNSGSFGQITTLAGGGAAINSTTGYQRLLQFAAKVIF